MQENEFEKRVQNRLAGLSLVPNEEVWKQVEARIRKEKRRRLIFYWLLAGLFLTGGIGTLIFLNHNNTSPLLNISSVKKPANDQKISDELLVKKPAITKKDEIFAEKKDAQKRIAKVPKETLQSSASARKTKVSDPGKTTLFRETPDENSELPKAKQKELILSKKENEILEAAKSIALNGLKNVPGSKLESKTELPPHKYYLSNINQKIASEALQKSVPPTEDKTSIKDTTGFLKNDNAIKEKNVKNILRKWKYGFTIYAGVSDNVTGSGSGLASPRTLADINSSLSQGPSAAATNIPPLSKLQYTSGLSFGAGMFLKKDLTQKLSVTAGIDYHFLSAKSMVGVRVDTAINIFDTASQRRTTAEFLYRGGRATTFSNQYHLVKFPINLQLQLNKNMNRPLVFSIGLSPSFLVASKALYLNNIARAYYVDKKQFNHFLLFAQTGLMYNIGTSSKYNLSIGPVLQYDLNSFSKTTTSRQHLIFTGLKTDITFK